MIDAVKWWWFECPDCQFDSDEAGCLERERRGICPLCAGDNGRDVVLRYRPATTEEIERLTREKDKQP